MGSVWSARHTELDVPLAIKFMDPAFAASAEARGRFEREAKASAKLQSPHVVQVHDYGVDDEIPYIVMELLVGEDLGHRLKRERRLPLKATAGIVTQIAKALRRAHEESIVHRDLKPGNIFISRKDDEEVVKVLDFGIAKARLSTEDAATKTGTLVGSPHYMSPEQSRNSKNLDHRSDLWSLGVVIFRAITGRHPFPGDELAEVILAICADPIPKPSQIDPDLGPEVDQFFARALSRDPAGRFQSAKEMADAFATVAGTALSGPSVVQLSPALVRAVAGIPLEAGTPPPADGSPTGPRLEPPAATSGAQPAAGTGQSLADPLSSTGTLAPAGATLGGAPKKNRAPLIAAVATAGLLALGAVGFFATHNTAPTPPGPSLAQTGAATVQTAPPSSPTVTAADTVTPAAVPPVVATATAAAVAATPTATATAAVTAASATAVAAAQPQGAPVTLGETPKPPAQPVVKAPPKKKEDSKKPVGNPLLGF